MLKIVHAVILSSALALSLAACGGEAAKWEGKYKKLIDEACACADTACLEPVVEKRFELRREFRDAYQNDEATGKKLAKELSSLDKKWDECEDKLRGSGE